MNKQIIGLLASSALIIAVGCGDDETTTTTTTTTNAGGSTTTTTTTGGNGAGGNATGGSGGSTGFPVMPTVGLQVDRLGRPAINTAANQTFTPDAVRGAAEDLYNQNGNPTNWATHVPNIASTIAILDGLDNLCGNQALSCNDATAGCYDGLAGVLANDRLAIDSSIATCDGYLAVEVGVITGTAHTTCGGRKPADDVIATSYSLLSGTFPTVFDDTITVSAAAGSETFPFLLAPL